MEKKERISALNIAQNQIGMLVDLLTEMVNDETSKWKKGWKAMGVSSFANYKTGKGYQGGFNMWNLYMDMVLEPTVDNEEKSGYFVTSNQAKEFGWTKKKSFEEATKKSLVLIKELEALREESDSFKKSIKEKYGKPYYLVVLKDEDRKKFDDYKERISKLNKEIYINRKWRDIFFFEFKLYRLIENEDGEFIQQFLSNFKDKETGDYKVTSEKKVTKEFWDNHPDAQNKVKKSFSLRYYSVVAIENYDRTTGKTIKAREAKIEGPKDSGVRMPKEIWDKVLFPYIEREKIGFEYQKQDKAYYSPALDKIVLPTEGQFDSSEELLATAVHELCHSTGHEKRLKRDIKNFFGDEKYCKEELVAELGAMFFMLREGILNEELLSNSLTYVKGYLSHIEKNNSSNNIFYGVNNSYKALDYIYGSGEVTNDEEESSVENE